MFNTISNFKYLKWESALPPFDAEGSIYRMLPQRPRRTSTLYKPEIPDGLCSISENVGRLDSLYRISKDYSKYMKAVLKMCNHLVSN